jgi:hypothetical protein
METCPILKEVKSFGARLAGASVTIIIAILLDVSRGTVCKVMSAYTNHVKTTLTKRISGRISALTERDHPDRVSG